MQNYMDQAQRIISQKKIIREASDFILENVRVITSIYELTTISRCDKQYFEDLIHSCVKKLKIEWQQKLKIPFEKPNVKITYSEDTKTIDIKLMSDYTNDNIEYSYVIEKILSINNDGDIISKSTSHLKKFYEKGESHDE